MKKAGVIIIAIVIILAAAVFFSFFYYKKCSDLGCFNSALSNCIKASYINEAQDASWLYKIEGGKGGIFCFLVKSQCEQCKINVKLLQVKQGATDLSAIQGLGMNCYLPFSYVDLPQADLSRCHGLLKEEMQDLIIKKMHSYIIEHVGEISEELNKAV